MNKEIEITFLKEAENYFNKLPQKMKDKFTYSFTKTEYGFKGEWFKKLNDSRGIFEFKQRDQDKFYRIFAFWDGTGKDKTLIVATHGIDKKKNQTPRKEIKKAEVIKAKYFKQKKES
jgi:phage-related protein